MWFGFPNTDPPPFSFPTVRKGLTCLIVFKILLSNPLFSPTMKTKFVGMAPLLL